MNLPWVLRDRQPGGSKGASSHRPIQGVDRHHPSECGTRPGVGEVWERLHDCGNEITSRRRIVEACSCRDDIRDIARVGVAPKRRDGRYGAGVASPVMSSGGSTRMASRTARSCPSLRISPATWAGM
jgi:hypothetical protein